MRYMCSLLCGAGLALLALAAAGRASAADHREAPIIQLDTRADIADVFMFVSPAAADRMVLMLTVNPLAGLASPETFTPGVKYSFEVFNDADLKPDVVFTIKFGKVQGSGQDVKVSAKGVDAKLQAQGPVGALLNLGGGAELGSDTVFTAGLFDDPFFFDVSFSRLPPKGPGGIDFYAGTNVLGMVLETPLAGLIPNPNDPLIAVSAVAKKGATDRLGRPLVNQLLIPLSARDAFNKTAPAKQEGSFTNAAITSLLPFYSGPNAAAVANFLLPDLLPIDTSLAPGFFNGRRPQDDVADAMLDLVSAGTYASDGVDANDVPFLTTFPYLASPH